MNKEQVLRDKKNSILNGQLLTSMSSIIAIILGIVIIIDQKEKANDKDGFLTDNESQTIALITKLIFLFVVIYSLSLNYESLNLSKATNQDTSSLELQIKASYLSIIVALVGLYVVITNYNDSSFQPSEIENNF